MVTNGTNLVAVTGTLLLAVARAPGAMAGAVLTAAALLATAWLVRREAARHRRLLTTLTGTRLLLLIGVTLGYLRRRPDDDGWIWLATALALLVIVSEPMIAILLSKAEQVAVNLPGVRPVPDPPFPPGLITWVTLGQIALTGAFAVWGVPGWLYVIVAAAGSSTALIMVFHAGRANLIRRRSLNAVSAALKKHRPVFAVYYGAVHGAGYQLGMWLPYLERLDLPFVVITRAAETVRTITPLTRAPVVVPQRNSAYANLDSLVVASLTAAFYVQGSRANLGLLRFRQLTHVWLNHGDADKVANYSGRHAAYDKVFVAGQRGIDRYAAHGIKIRKDRLVIVGRPQVEKIEVRDEPLPVGEPRTVLYAPTWRGGRPATDYSSLSLGDQIIDALLSRQATVIFRPHPLSYTDPADGRQIRSIQERLASDQRESGRQHRWGRESEQIWDLPSCINFSDALITDVSSVASDYLASGKPFAMVAMRGPGEVFRQQYPTARYAYLIERDLSTLNAAIDQLHGADPLAEQRRMHRRHCLGDEIGSRAPDAFLQAARRVIAGEPVGKPR